MGTFQGHALPGIGFILLGLWHVYHILKTYYRRRGFDLHLFFEHVPPYVSRHSFPVELGDNRWCKKRIIPADSIFKLVICIFGIIVEATIEFTWQTVEGDSVQHIGMYSAFGLSGLVEILLHIGILEFPLEVEFVFGTVALLAEAFLFMFHLHGRTAVNIFLHLLLLGSVFLSFIAGLCELLIPDQAVYGLLRSWGFIAQGTWFWQVGSTLYHPFSWMPTWNEEITESIPRATNLFCYHLLATFVTILLIAMVMCVRYTQMDAKMARNRLEVVNGSCQDDTFTRDKDGRMECYLDIMTE